MTRTNRRARTAEDDRPRVVVDAHARRIPRVRGEAESPADERRRHGAGDDGGEYRAGAEIRPAPRADDPSERSAGEDAAERRSLAQQAQPCTDEDPDGCGDRGRREIELGLVPRADDQSRRDADGEAADEGDDPSSRRVVRRRQRTGEHAERERTDQGAEDPGEESAAGADRDQVSMEHDAEEGTEHPEREHVESDPSRADQVEQQIGEDPQRSGQAGRDKDGDDGGEDLRLDERPIGEAGEEQHGHSGLEASSGAAGRRTHRVVVLLRSRRRTGGRRPVDLVHCVHVVP